MLKKILIGFAALILGFLIVVALQPSTFHVERSATIAATPQAVFEQVNDHRKFLTWSPWARLDPNVKNTFTGPDSGVGSACSWDGNNQVGAGSATITESKPGELVRMRMDWKRPMEGVAMVAFTLKPEGNKTTVTWAMDGTNNFLGRAVSLFMNCEKMIGPPFEEGLRNLKTIVEAPGKP